MQITTALAQFDRHLQADGRSPHNIASYLRSLRALGDIDVQDVTADHVARVILSDAVQ